MTVISSSPGNVAGIQFLRFAAALLVVIRHSREIQNKFYPVFADSNLTYLTGFGSAGVHIFFVISGFVMAYTTRTKFGKPGSTAEFWFRRFCRIYPPYWMYAALYLIFHSVFFAGYDLSAGRALSALLLFPTEAGSIIGPGWTLVYEIYFYLCFGLALMLPKRLGLASLTFFFLFSVGAGLASRIDEILNPQYFNALLLEFLLGAWIARFFEYDVKLSSPLFYMAIVGGVGLLIGGILYGYEGLPTVLSWGVPGALLVFGVVGVERSGNLPRFARRLSFLGDSSYSLYLIHTLFVDLTLAGLSRLGVSSGSVFIDLTCIVTAAVLTGIVVYKYVELPLVQISRRAVASILPAQ